MQRSLAAYWLEMHAETMQQLAHSDSGNIRKFSGIPVPSATRKKVNDGPLTTKTRPTSPSSYGARKQPWSVIALVPQQHGQAVRVVQLLCHQYLMGIDQKIRIVLEVLEGGLHGLQDVFD